MRATAVVMLLAACLWPSRAGAAEPGVILDQTAYWRHYFSYAPPAVSAERMTNEGLKYLGQAAMKRVERRARIRAKRLGCETKDWPQHVIVVGASNQYTFSDLRVELLRWLRTDLPPAGWMRRGFDDGDWARQRTLFGASRQVTAAFYRTRFESPDPPKAGALRLSTVYRGGIRVFLNGTEIARGHLPKGELAAEAPALPYPAAAYHLLDGEFMESMYHRTGYSGKYWKKVNGYVLAPEFPDAFEKIKAIYVNREKRIVHKEFRNAGSSCTVNARGWTRIGGVRDRRLEVEVPARLVRKGENVLAVESRASRMHPLATEWEKAYVRNCTWGHVGLRAVSLRGRGVPSALGRRPGVQVWATDIHRRLHEPDYFELSGGSRPARIVAARNGSFAAQLAVGTDRELTGLRASVGALRGPAGPALSARVRYFVPHHLAELRVGDRGRRLGNGFDFRRYERFTQARHGSGRVPYFDHLTATPPKMVPAGTCCPVWITVVVPAGAAPGRYRGTVSVQADGLEPVKVPLEVEVMDWRLPGPGQFITVLGLEQCPYAVAAHYKVPLWSTAHFALLDTTFRQLARVDNDWLNIPVLARTEFGNGGDSMVRVSRRRNGAYTADFSVLDRYLDLAIKHCGAPKVVSFTVMHAGNPGDSRMALSPMRVPIRDEATGKTELELVDREMPAKERRRFWRFLATSIQEHMKRRGLSEALHWGYTWDGVGVAPEMYELLAEFAPGVGWTKGSHKQPPSGYNRAVATAYNSNVAISLRGSRRGWKNPELWLTYPRYWGTVIDCADYSPPFSFRMLPDRALASGSRGIGRMGVDYWGRSYLGGMEKMTYPVGVPNLFLLWPGKRGPESSVRFEMLCEGLQETEARIFLEQAVEKLGGAGHADLRKRITELLDERTAETLLDPPAGTNPEAVELCSIGWQTRSRRLYAAASEAAGLIGADLDRTAMVIKAPARAHVAVPLTLRNWTGKPRAWTLSFAKAAAPLHPRTGKPDPRYTVPEWPVSDWLGAKQTAGSAAPGAGAVVVWVRTTMLTPGATCLGLIRFTDRATGRTDTVRLTVQVGGLMEVRGHRKVLNVKAGAPTTESFTLINSSGSALSWNVTYQYGHETRIDAKTRRPVPAKLGGVVPWLTASPKQGTLATGARSTVVVRATPPGRRRARHAVTLTVAEAGGATSRVPMTVHVLPRRVEAKVRPAGVAVPLQSLPKEAVVSHSEGGRRPRDCRLSFWKPTGRTKTLTVGKGSASFRAGLVVRVPQDTIYRIGGRGFTGFAAQVGAPSYFSSRRLAARWGLFRLHF